MSHTLRARQRRVSRTNFVDPSRHCTIQSPQIGYELLSVLSISEFGARIAFEPGQYQLKTYQVLVCQLNLGRVAVKTVSARVVHVRSDSFGIEFENPSVELRVLIRTYFRFELIGASLRPAPDWMPGKKLRLVNSSQDLFEIVVCGKTIEKFSAYFTRQSAEYHWDGSKGSLSFRHRPGRSDPWPVHRDHLLRVIQNIGEIEPAMKEKLLDIAKTDVVSTI